MQKEETVTDALHSSCDRHIKEEIIMNYATALTLSDWATEAQVYSQQVIRFTPIVFTALSKTIAPVTIASIKGFSNHWFESECYWRQRITNLAGVTHNPLQAAVRAAHAELTSAEAHATYRHIRHITRETAMDVLVIGLCGVVAVAQGIEVAQKVYRTAKRVYDWVDSRLNPAQPEPSILPSVHQFFAQDKAQEDIAAIIDEVGHERSFLMQIDRLDVEALASVCAKVDEAIAKAQQIKSARAPQATVQQHLAAEISPDFWLEPMPFTHTPPVVGPIWNPAPGRDMHTEVERLLRLQHVPLTLGAAAEPVMQPTRKGRGQTKAAAAPSKAEDELATALDVPGATGGKQRKPRAKASTGKAAADKPKPTRARAGAKAGAK
jgi:hypothetical protein